MIECGTPYAQQAMEEEWQRLIREAIKAKGGKVNSIAPEELRKLVREYLREHPDGHEAQML